MPPMRLFAPPFLLSAFLVGCALAPLSSIDGRLLTRAPIDSKQEGILYQYPVRIVSVDGSMQFKNPVQISPGPHIVVVEAAPSDNPRKTEQRTFALNIAPCTGYNYNALRTSHMAATWDLVVVEKEPVSGCNPEEEMKK